MPISPPRQQSSLLRPALIIGLVTFFSCAYFFDGGGWNQNSRFDLLRAIVEKHTLRIDDFHENTGDKAHFQGHFYSDKAPGHVFLTVPFVEAARPVMRMVGVDPQSAHGEYFLSYFVGLCTAALPASLGAVCFFFVAMRLGGSAGASAFAALIMVLGTPLWTYASMFWAHALVAACLLFAFAAALKLRESQSARADFFWALAVGLAAGWATVSEYPAAPAAAILAVFALAQVWPQGSARRWSAVAGVGVGALACVVVLMSYLYAAFGSFRPSYEYYDSSSFVFMHNHGYLGFTYPHIEVVLKLLFGSRRGLFFAAPVVIAAPFGLRWLWREKSTRAAAITIVSIVVYYFVFNATFYEWGGGRAYGPRYVSGAVPLLCLGLPVVWDRVGRRWRSVLMALAVCGLFSSLMVISTSSELPVVDRCPVCHVSWPAFWSGQMAMNGSSMLTAAEDGGRFDYGAFNLGQRMGLRGLWSLLPLLLVWGVAGFLLIRSASGALHARSFATPEERLRSG